MFEFQKITKTCSLKSVAGPALIDTSAVTLTGPKVCGFMESKMFALQQH